MADDARPVVAAREASDYPAREKRLTVGEFERMGELGFFPEPGKHELWDGRIMMAPPAGSPHMDCERRILEQLIVAIHTSGLRERFGVFASGGLQIGEGNLRSPDIMVATLPFDTSKRLTGAGVALVIEVAHSSLPDDLTEKRGKYAGAGIAEYWVIDVANKQLYPFRDPKAGDYPDCTPLAAGATISPLFAPDLGFEIAALV